MQKLARTSRAGLRGTRARPAIRRPQRPAALSGASVGVVLDGMGASVRRLNDYLVWLHVSGALALLAFCVEDIAGGGPARPAIVPILGAYMSASVVFYTVLKERGSALLVWINGLSDVALLVAVQRLAFLGMGPLGPDLTVALSVATVAAVYGTAGIPRLSAAMGSIVTAFFCFTIVSPTTGYPVLDARSVASLLIVIAAALAGYRLALAARRRELSNTILKLERIEAAVAIHRLRHEPAATPA